MIKDAITALKEKTGSSQYAIAKFIEEKHKQLPSNFRKLLLYHLKKLVAAGKLVKVKGSFKLLPYAPPLLLCSMHQPWHNYTHPSSPSTQTHAEPAKKFPFTLDPFQSQAITCLENGESIMVSAHTSAGKTVVALYAIAKSLRDGQRVTYTSPIKALSNQKYREFKEEFSDVGLMTGDVTIDPNASCLVMTTEIWRSMQYKGSEVTREVAGIVFDEVHYMRDGEI